MEDAKFVRLINLFILYSKLYNFFVCVCVWGGGGGGGGNLAKSLNFKTFGNLIQF
jgi:hypothetical protein